MSSWTVHQSIFLSDSITCLFMWPHLWNKLIKLGLHRRDGDWKQYHFNWLLEFNEGLWKVYSSDRQLVNVILCFCYSSLRRLQKWAIVVNNKKLKLVTNTMKETCYKHLLQVLWSAHIKNAEVHRRVHTLTGEHDCFPAQIKRRKVRDCNKMKTQLVCWLSSFLR